MIPIERQSLQLMLELMRVHAEIHQRANEHVATDAAEYIEIESFHIIGNPPGR